MNIIKAIAIAKSEIVHTEEEQDFESSDYFLHILGKTRDQLPGDHYFLPFLEKEDIQLGEIHFLPEGNAVADDQTWTRNLLIGVAALQEYVLALENNSVLKPDRIYGRSDNRMGELSEAVGFTTHSSKDGSSIISTTPAELIKGVQELKKRLTPELLEKLKKRSDREKSRTSK